MTAGEAQPDVARLSDRRSQRRAGRRRGDAFHFFGPNVIMEA
ncbi:MAG: hypothetical protein OXG69_02455 [bacterium]|nr:hypothetical protein [bacterium]